MCVCVGMCMCICPHSCLHYMCDCIHACNVCVICFKKKTKTVCDLQEPFCTLLCSCSSWIFSFGVILLPILDVHDVCCGHLISSRWTSMHVVIFLICKLYVKKKKSKWGMGVGG